MVIEGHAALKSILKKSFLDEGVKYDFGRIYEFNN